MTSLLDLFSAGFEPATFAGLIAASFGGSFIAASLGVGGGALLLAIMATLMPPAALIPVHGVIQLGSNALRGAVLRAHVYWRPVLAFGAGSAIGAAIGGSVAISLEPALIQIGVGAFVIWSVLARPPLWLSRYGAVTGVISSFLTMFFGATGVFVANFVKSLKLPRQSHVATHAVLMTLQHSMKIVVFGLLGFAYGPWIGFMIAMIAAGFLGTLAGKAVLERVSDMHFRRIFDVVLVLISLRLIWVGLQQLAT